MKTHNFAKSIYTKTWLVLSLLVGLSLSPAVAYATTFLSQSYLSADALTTGSMVSLKKGTTDQVEAGNANNANYLLGVVIDGNNSELTISSNQKNEVHVATNGIEPVLVSDINGKIAVGDAITASPINGVGMKATANAKIVGVAQDSFPNSSAKKQSFTDQNKQKQSAMIGQIPVLINVAYYYKQPDKTIIPPALQNVANALAGKKVNALPILISAVIFIVTLIIVVSFVYSMIHSSIISVGRNPMSQAAVYRNVIQLSALVIVILGVAVGSIYMVLTKF